MNREQKPVVVIVSLQIQTSFQAVPLGAACVVSALRASDGLSGRVDARLVDFSLEDEGLAQLDEIRAGQYIARQIISAHPNVAIAGFSVYVWNRRVLEAAARELRRLVPGLVTFAGGPEVTAAPGSFNNRSSGVYRPVGMQTPIIHTDRSDEDAPFDHLILGEGESASVSLVRSIIDSAPIPNEIATGERQRAEDCAALSSPWLMGVLDECVSVRECRGALWELSRGCPYSCAYCYESKGEKKVRYFSMERLERELDYFVKNGIERAFILDPTYNASRNRALSLLRLIAKKAPNVHFNFEARAEHLDREMVEAFSRIPCSLQIGLQSTNQESLKLVNRPCDIHAFSKKIGLLNEAGVVFGLDLMYGLPADSLTGFRASLDYALSLYPNNLEIFRLAVLPGTALAEQAASLGLRHASEAPYLVESTPKFSALDIARAASLARACDAFYTQGRAVTWFLSVLRPLKLKSSQFLQDFADFLAERHQDDGREFSQSEAEALQVQFIQRKYAEKGKGFLLPAVCDTIRLNGAWTRALAEGEETKLALSYHPEDLMSADAMDPEYFVENAYMENCTVRVFPGSDGPEMEIM